MMEGLEIKVLHSDGKLAKRVSGLEEINMLYDAEYREGDRIVFSAHKIPCYLALQVDEVLGEAFVYLVQKEISFVVPFGEKRICYSPKTFIGDKHLLTARMAREDEIKSYRNLALNVMDQHEEVGCYPHASANVETRGEAVFAARNAIDGIKANSFHGEWPYGSWGINRQADAAMKVAFGRLVEVDKLALYIRADFPHDSWWTKVTVTFSDGSSFDWSLEKTEKAQTISFDKKQIEWIMLSQLIKAEDDSPFPALTQLEVYGNEV